MESGSECPLKLPCGTPWDLETLEKEDLRQMCKIKAVNISLLRVSCLQQTVKRNSRREGKETRRAEIHTSGTERISFFTWVNKTPFIRRLQWNVTSICFKGT
jgi:hypothetical protein